MAAFWGAIRSITSFIILTIVPYKILSWQHCTTITLVSLCYNLFVKQRHNHWAWSPSFIKMAWTNVSLKCTVCIQEIQLFTFSGHETIFPTGCTSICNMQSFISGTEMIKNPPDTLKSLTRPGRCYQSVVHLVFRRLFSLGKASTFVLIW